MSNKSKGVWGRSTAIAVVILGGGVFTAEQYLGTGDDPRTRLCGQMEMMRGLDIVHASLSSPAFDAMRGQFTEPTTAEVTRILAIAEADPRDCGDDQECDPILDHPAWDTAETEVTTVERRELSINLAVVDALATRAGVAYATDCKGVPSLFDLPPEEQKEIKDAAPVAYASRRECLADATQDLVDEGIKRGTKLFKERLAEAKKECRKWAN